NAARSLADAGWHSHLRPTQGDCTMTTRTALFALLAMWGVGTCVTLPTLAEEAASEDQAEADSPTRRDLTNRVWVKEDDGGLPGVMRIFLSDGTLVQDSCWETHRLSEWK